MSVSSVAECSCNQNNTIIFIEYIYMKTSMLSASLSFIKKEIYLPVKKETFRNNMLCPLKSFE